LCGYGVVLGMLGSMESLMSSSALENLSDINVDSNKELLGQGVGNIIASLFGSISSAGSIIRSHANIKAGGKSRLSGAICSAIMFICIWTIAPLISKIPLSIFAGVIISVGLTLLDLSVLRFARFYSPFSGIQKDIFISLFVHVCVIIITVTVSLTSAVLIGTLLSTAYFIVKMGMTSIRRQYSGLDITSKKIRQSVQYSCLKNNGKEIQIFELQGPIFFGSADKLTRLIESRTRDATFCILDMNHVSEIDSTGAIILIRLYKRFLKSGKRLLITHIHDGHSIKDFLTVTGLLSELNEKHIFLDTDEALEWAEDRIISELCYINDHKKYKLGELEVLHNFNDDELEIFKQFLDLKTFKKGEAIINEGQADRDLLMLTHGLVSITLHLPNSDRKNRLFTFSSGATIGEMALLDGNPRSADVWADDDSEFYRLTYDGYKKICDDYPQIALKLVTNIGSVISHRLRIRSQELRMLADR
jgi:sulfate permease, SulP family